MSEFTVAASPPRQMRERFSMWDALFDECRKYPNEWRKVKTPMKRSTATQLASDIRNAHKRSAAKARLRGLNTNERWDAAWGEEGGEYHIWLMYLGKQ